MILNKETKGCEGSSINKNYEIEKYRGLGKEELSEIKNTNFWILLKKFLSKRWIIYMNVYPN
jgi:hypothetical protein